jgi:hypothetical protein
MEDPDKQLHRTLLKHVTETRSRLSEANIGSAFALTITVSGRLNSSDPLKIAYRLTSGTWGENPTEGSALTPVTEEFLRRHGWNKTYAPLALPPPEDELVVPPPAPSHGTLVIDLPAKAKADDDLPF